jgi:hypothetical protein
MEEEKKCAAFLSLPENKNMLALFKEDAKESIKHLIDIIKEKGLTPLRSEYEFLKSFSPFSNPHGFVDLLLEDGNGNLVIFDLKWSDSTKTYPDKIKKGEAYQLYMYKHAVEAQTGKTVAWYAYYLFPLMELYTEPDGVTTKWEEWEEMRNNRLDQLFKEGIIESTIHDSPQDKYPKHKILKNLKMK